MIVQWADRLAVTSSPVADTDDRDDVAQLTSRVAVLLDHVAGPLLGSAIAVVLMFALRGRPVPHERAAAEGGALPLSS